MSVIASLMSQIASDIHENLVLSCKHLHLLGTHMCRLFAVVSEQDNPFECRVLVAAAAMVADAAVVADAAAVLGVLNDAVH